MLAAAGEKLGFTKSLDAAVSRAAQVFRSGGIVVFPTETVYGIGALASDAGAVLRLRELKRRSDRKPFQFLVADMDAAEKLGAVFSRPARWLAETFWPGSLTLVLPDGTNPGSTLGVRVPSSPFMEALLRELDGAVVSSSANPAGMAPPDNADAADAFGDAVDLLIDGGTARGTASTVVRCTGGDFEILRSGGVTGDGIRLAWNGKNPWGDTDLQ